MVWKGSLNHFQKNEKLFFYLSLFLLHFWPVLPFGPVALAPHVSRRGLLPHRSA
jgi:hypothetical protein